ncbi:MAG: ATP-binding cassette domain-containing protein [Actinobacteria bacterium]|nr:ATP-binding cassette domain-containing protein [Actinomycetota bacterium]
MGDVAETVLQAEDLHFEYDGGVVALDGLDLSVHRGVRHAIVGANGAGKTTLFLHLNGTLRPKSGQVRVNSRPADYSRAGLTAWRQVVGLVFQNPDDMLFAGTVYQDVSFGPINLGLGEHEARARVDEALEALGIPHLRDRPTHMLSFGQKKRASIAGAMAMRPEVLIIDEPLSGLDPSGAEQFLGVLHELHTNGTTVLVATHDMSLAYQWADEVSIMNGGHILAQGPPTTVMSHSELLASCGLRRPWVLDLEEELETAGLLTCELGSLRCRADVLTAIAAAGVGVPERGARTIAVPEGLKHEVSSLGLQQVERPPGRRPRRFGRGSSGSCTCD